MGKKIQTQAYADFNVLSLALAEGRLDAIPEKIVVNLKSASMKDYQTLLELIRYRPFGHHLLKSAEQKDNLQNVRSLINTGKFNEAIETTKDSIEDAELLLEHVRALVSIGEYEKVKTLLATVVNDEKIPTNSRGVLWQLKGQALLELGYHKEAENCFEMALLLAERCGNTLGKISVHLFLAKLRAFGDDFEQAHHFMGQALTEIMLLGGFRWLLGSYRQLSHLSYLEGSDLCFSEAYTGILIARALGDHRYEAKGWTEYAIMESRFGIKKASTSAEIKKFVELHCKPTDSELLSWKRTAFKTKKAGNNEQGSLGLPETLRQFMSKAQMAIKPTELTSKMNYAVLPFPNPSWVYDRKRELVIDLDRNGFLKLASDSPSAKILIHLAKSVPLKGKGISLPDLFEEIWRLKWQEERHKNLIGVTLHRLSHFSPSLVLQRKEGCVRLTHAGIII